MWRSLFLILILFSSIAFAQTQEKKEAYKFFEYEKISDNLLKEKMDSLCEESAKSTWVGWVIFFGTQKEVANREKQLLLNYKCRQEFPDPRIIFVRSRENGKSRTEFWMAPPNIEPPILKSPTHQKPQAYKFDEFGNVPEKIWKAKLDKLYDQQQGKDNQIYVVLFGPAKLTDKITKKYLNFFTRNHQSKMQITSWGVQKNLKTIIWIVPPGAKPPSPNTQN